MAEAAPKAGPLPTWPSLPVDHPLSKFSQALPALCKEAECSEVYGIDLQNGTIFQKNLILQKFLRANSNEIEKAQTQLLETLKWRKSFDPKKTRNEIFNKKKYGGLGFVTNLKGVPGSPNEQDVCTFNIYGAVADSKATFGDLEEFLRWRVALMEISIAALGLPNATQPIPDYGQGPDRFQSFQVHDYLGVSFIRQDANQKAAAKEAIATFQKYYPETLSRKFFVNVPVVMGMSKPLCCATGCG